MSVPLYHVTEIAVETVSRIQFIQRNTNTTCKMKFPSSQNSNYQFYCKIMQLFRSIVVRLLFSNDDCPHYIFSN